MLLGAVLSVLFIGPAGAKDILIFAAASLNLSLQEIIAEYRKSIPKAPKIRASYAASSTLAQQIMRGAPADIYLSASTEWMDFLERRKAIAPNTRFNLLENSLVIVVPVKSRQRKTDRLPLPGLLADGRLAVADPDHVPAGIYAKGALRTLGLWKLLAPRLAATTNARAALALVERGETPVGIVYSSDAAFNKRVRRVYTFPANVHPKIEYAAAIVARRDRPGVKQFFDRLKSGPAKTRFRRWGFKVD